MNSESAWLDMTGKPEFSWLAESKRYLWAAEVLRESDEYASGKLLITPTLHLIAHGAELFLKGTLIRSGATDMEVRKFGHDILELWNHAQNLTTRTDVLTAADEEWEAAKQNSKWLDDFSLLPRPPFEEHLQRLSELHTKQSDFALRYVTGRTPTTEGPKPHLLGATFYRVADRYLREMTYTNP